VIVLDASALLELILATPTGKVIAERIADPALSLHTPHLADIEVAQALRHYVREGEIAAADAEVAIEDLRSLDLARHGHEPFLDRIWSLRDNVPAYDAVYVALAEVLDGVLLTADARLARAPGAACEIEVAQG